MPSRARKTAGLTVLILDILKGFLVVIFLGNLMALKVQAVSPELLRISFGLSCIAGHNWTVFLRFKGARALLLPWVSSWVWAAK